MDTFNSDDQLAALKAWWKQYGVALIAGVMLGVVVLVGIKYWREHRMQKAETASQLYELLVQNYQTGKPEDVVLASRQLIEGFESTPYAGKAALLLARNRFDAGDLPGARQQLEWAMKNARESAVQHSARLRLARLQMDQGDAEGALATIKVRDTEGFTSEYEEIKGDLLLAKGDRDGARRAYQAALDSLPRNSGYGRLLSMKRDNLGPEGRS